MNDLDPRAFDLCPSCSVPLTPHSEEGLCPRCAAALHDVSVAMEAFAADVEHADFALFDEDLQYVM